MYWHERLVEDGRAAEAAEFLALLDRLGGGPDRAEPGWDPAHSFGEGALALAVRHVRYRARVLASVIRAGALPADHYDYLFQGGAPRPIDLEGLPRAVHAAWETLCARPPRALSERQRSG